MRVAGLDLVDADLIDVCRAVKIGLSEVELDDVQPPVCAALDIFAQLEGVFGAK